MLDILTGFGVVGVAIALGYVLGRIDLLGPEARTVLGKLVFFALSPFLLFVVLAQADVHTLFSSLLPVSALAAAAIFAIYGVVAAFVWNRSVGEVVIGALSAGQVNANNIGIPISLYVLGNAAYSAPVILMQLLVFTPASLALLDYATADSRSFGRIAMRAVTNPMVVGAVAGLMVAVLGISLPSIVLEPVQLVANAAIPILLISYGISLNGQKPLGSRGCRRDILLAASLKMLAMPVIAWVLAAFVFRLPQDAVLACVVLAALPTAQAIFNYAQRYDVGESVARDAILITTIGCVPIILVSALLLQ